jgi:hypothetical protein
VLCAVWLLKNPFADRRNEEERPARCHPLTQPWRHKQVNQSAIKKTPTIWALS